MHRPTIGIITLLLLAAIPVLHYSLPADEAQLWISGCIRVGLIMGGLWLAHPQLVKIPPKFLLFFFLGFFALMIFIIKQPRAIVMLAAIALFLAWLKPRIEGRPPRKQR